MGVTTSAFRGVWRAVFVDIMGSLFWAELVTVDEHSSVTGPQGNDWVIGQTPSHSPLQFCAFPEDQCQSASFSGYPYMEK